MRVWLLNLVEDWIRMFLRLMRLFMVMMMVILYDRLLRNVLDHRGRFAVVMLVHAVP